MRNLGVQRLSRSHTTEGYCSFEMVQFAIRTENLTRDFTAVRAIDQLTLEVPTGIVFGFLGPNGAGKTTTIRLLLGLLEASAGSAEVLGYDVGRQADDVRQRCGALLEHSGLYERLSAEDNLDYYARIWRLPASHRRARIDELLKRLDLSDRRKEIVADWTRGMRQKLAVARALLHRPSLLFLDEPTAGLDPMASASLRDDLAGLAAKEGVTVFLTTHNLAEAEKLCQMVGVIRDGRLIACSPTGELRNKGRPRVTVSGRGFTDDLMDTLRRRPDIVSAELKETQLFIELRSGADTASLIRHLVNNGAEIEEVRKASLEDVFLTLMKEENR